MSLCILPCHPSDIIVSLYFDVTELRGFLPPIPSRAISSRVSSLRTSRSGGTRPLGPTVSMLELKDTKKSHQNLYFSNCGDMVRKFWSNSLIVPDLDGYWWPPTYSNWLLVSIFCSARLSVLLYNCEFYTSRVV
jgi:hypothetical protein